MFQVFVESGVCMLMAKVFNPINKVNNGINLNNLQILPQHISTIVRPRSTEVFQNADIYKHSDIFKHSDISSKLILRNINLTLGTGTISK